MPGWPRSIQWRSSKISIKRLIEALAQQDAFDRVEGAAPARLRIHLRERVGLVGDSE